jgi:hypothetical protein
MYEQRGYRIPSFGIEPHDLLRQITLEACHGEATTGTMTVALDSTGRLKAEELYQSEIASFRKRGARVCEFTRLAVDTECNAKQTLAYLFHLAVIFAHRIYDATDLFIEVNPRHTLFYRRKLGFLQIGEEKICARVNAPAVLLHRSLRELAKDVRRFGGVRSAENNTFYALWLTHAEENEMVREIEHRLSACQALSYPLGGGEEATASPARSA